MAISIQCGSCGRSYRVKDELAGRKARCQDCGTAIQIPAASTVSTQEAEVMSTPPERAKAKTKAPEPSPISSPARQKPLSERKQEPEVVTSRVEKIPAGAPQKRPRVLLVVLTIVLLGLVKFSVRRYLADQPGGTGNGSSAATARDFSKWVSYEAPDKSFQIRLPATPQVSSNDEGIAKTTYRCAGADLAVEISTTLIGHDFVGLDEQNAALEQIAEGVRKNLRHSPGFGEARLEYLGVPAREFSISVGQNPAIRRYFLSHQQLFAVQCVRIGKDKSASWASQNEVLSSMRPQIPDFTTGDTLSALDPVGSAQNQTSPSNLGSQVPETTAPAKPFLERRAGFRTKLIRQGPSPQEWKAESPPEGVTEITYPSGELQLKAWIARPSGSSEEKHPALVYFHGGFAFGAEDFEVCRDFLKEGFVVMTPVLRGENGNPGQFELFFGEVEDGCAAVRWLAAQPYVKRDQIFAFGHSAGGGITTMMSLFEDLPLHHCGSAGGLYTAEILSEWSNLIPFDTSDPEEFRQRVLIGNVRDMKRNHFAYLGTDDTITASAVLNSAREVGADSMLTISQLTGDHFSSLKLAAERYLSVCRIDANMMELKNLTEQAQASAATARQFQIDMQQRTQREESGPGKRAAECEVRAEYETDPAIKATFYAIAANRRIECGEKEKAAEDLRLSLESGSDVVSKNPGEFYRLIGGVQMSLGQYSESLVNLEKSLQLTSDERERESIQVMITNLRTLSESAADGKP